MDPAGETEVLDAFPAPLAAAVVAELRAAGVDAHLHKDGDSSDVLVPSGLREPAWATLAERMEAVQDRVRAAEGQADTGGPDRWVPLAADTEPEGHRRLVSERLRGGATLLALVLVPLLVVTLSRVRLPTAAVVAIVVGGAALLWTLSQRRS